MKFSCEKAELQNACATAARAVASKSPMPAVEGILMTADKRLRVTGYDLKKAIYTDVQAGIQQPGAIVINSRFLAELLRRMPDGIITFTSDNNLSVNIRCGKTNFNISGISAEDYPELPRMDEQNSVSLPQSLLKKMITNTIFAISTNDMRPVYTGILFDICCGELTMVAVDGYRLAKRSEELKDCSTEDCSFIVPGSTLADVEKICQDNEEIVRISVGEKHISFFIGETVIISRRLEGEFLNYRNSIPTNFKTVMEVEKNSMISTVDRVALIISDKSSIPLRVSFQDGFIKCNCFTSLGNAEDICLCKGTADGMEIGFNDKYLMDALRNASCDRLEICVNTPSSPCIIRPCDEKCNFTYMILPVRLRAGE